MANGKRGKVRFVQGRQDGNGVTVDVPRTRRMALRAKPVKVKGK